MKLRRAIVPLVVFYFLPLLLHAQAHYVLCQNGEGDYQSTSYTGVSVQLGTAHNGQLATRTCEATLAWERQMETVATSASELDLDVFGADLGFGIPVAAFQVKQSEKECCMTYRIYSLQKPPQLLRTITGGGFFEAADKDLDGQVEIWTDDLAAAEHFDNVALDFAPTIVLRYQNGRLLDVSAEFQSYYDAEIEKLRRNLGAQDTFDFQNSDGKLAASKTIPARQLEDLRRTKAAVLEIVWAYLYSGREPQAWRALNEMWPAADIARIRAAIADVHARGIAAQTDGLTRSTGHKHATVFDAVNAKGCTSAIGPGCAKSAMGSATEVTPPRAILLRRSVAGDAADRGALNAEVLVELVVDAAGKVRSAKPAGEVAWNDRDLLDSATGWKFVPASSGTTPVAARMRMYVSLKQ